MKAEPATAGPDHLHWVPLLELATREVFEMMLGCQLQKLEDHHPTPPELTAMVGLAGRLCGVLSVRCESKSAVVMAAKMLGIPPNQVNGQIQDAVGEIANMVAGNFKNKVSGMGSGCWLSLPTVISGSDYKCRSLASSGKIEVHFLFDGSPLCIDLEVHG